MAAIFKAQKDPVIPETPTLPNGRKDSLFSYRYYKDHFWDNIPPSDDRLLRTPIFHVKQHLTSQKQKKLKKQILNYIGIKKA